MVKNEFGRREREFIKGFCKRTFGYFTPHFYRLLLVIGLLLLFLVWFSKNYTLSYTEDIEEFFIPDKEIITFEGPIELSEKIKFLLQREQLLQAIASRGHERFMREHESKIRLNSILDKIMSL